MNFQMQAKPQHLSFNYYICKTLALYSLEIKPTVGGTMNVRWFYRLRDLNST